MKSIGKLGGQNKVPRLSNDRKIADELINGRKIKQSEKHKRVRKAELYQNLPFITNECTKIKKHASALQSSGDGNIRRIAIFGSTGSIGRQALEIIAANPDKFSAEILTAHSNDEFLIQQALKFNPNMVVIGDEKKYDKVKEAFSSTDIKVFAGENRLEEAAAMDCYDLMLAAIVGYAGLRPTLQAIKTGKPVALGK